MDIFSTKTIWSKNFQQIDLSITYRKDKLNILWVIKFSTNTDAK